MTTITFGGNTIHTQGTLPAVGNQAPVFSLTRCDLLELKSSEFKGKKILLNIFPSLDTSVCAESVRRFNKEASQLNNTQVLCVSADLPFAQSRFCTTEGITNVIAASDFQHKEFGETYGVRILDGALAGLLSRAVVVIGSDGKITYTEQVPELSREPNYVEALKALQ